MVLAKKFPMSKTNLVHFQNTQKMSLGATGIEDSGLGGSGCVLRRGLSGN